MKKQLFLLVLFLSCISRYAVAQIDPVYAGLLQYTLDSVCKKNKIKGISAAVYVPNQGIWTGVYGESHAGVQITPDMYFPIGSNTKTFTAAIILKLQENGQLSINDTIGKWLINIPNVNGQITVKQLLNHTSGLYSYTDNPDFFADLNADYAHVYQPEDMLKYIKAPIAAPGAPWSYCNTNFLLLGLIIKNITGQPVYKNYRDMIFDPQGFSHTVFYPQEQPNGTIPHGWADAGKNYMEDMQVAYNYENTAFLSMATSAGAIVSTASDNVRFWNNLMTGQIINAGSLAQMTDVLPLSTAFGYGLGIMRLKNFNGHTVYSHGGTCFGYLNENVYDSIKGLAITVLSNQDSIDNDMLSARVVKALHKIALNIPPTTVHALNVDAGVRAYPNPASDRLIVSMNNIDTAVMDVYDMTGRKVMHQVIYKGDNNVYLNIAEGSYISRIESNGQLLYTHKLRIVK